MLSADVSPWLIHDETLERTTSGVGKLCDTPDAVLRTLVVRACPGGAFARETIPTFESAAALCRRLGLQANVEIKPADGFEALTGEVVARRIIELWRDAPLPLVSSFSEMALAAARRLAPQLPMGCLWDKAPADWRERLDRLGAHSLHCAADVLDDAVMAEAQADGIPVLCYTVNERRFAESLFRRGVRSVFSDRIDLLDRM